MAIDDGSNVQILVCVDTPDDVATCTLQTKFHHILLNPIMT